MLQLLVRMGYGGLEKPTEHLGGSGDAGLDGLIRLDVLGLDIVYLQAKRYTDRHVGWPEIQASLVRYMAHRPTAAFSSPPAGSARTLVTTRNA